MAFSGFSATPTVTEWNEVFTDLATRLNAITETTAHRVFDLPVQQWDATALTSGSAESVRSLYFTAPMDMQLEAIACDTHAAAATTLSGTLSPTVTDFLLEQGVSANYPKGDVTTIIAGKLQDSDLTLNNSHPVNIRRGGQYKLVAADSGGNSTSFCVVAQLSSSGKRI